MLVNIEFWFCCLNPREREVLRATIECWALSLGVGCPKTVWDGFWLIHPDVSSAVIDAFMAIYQLEIVTIEVGDPPVPLDVVVPLYPLAYAAFALYIASPAAACSGGCLQSSVP
jgi:hypothetical protein